MSYLNSIDYNVLLNSTEGMEHVYMPNQYDLYPKSEGPNISIKMCYVTVQPKPRLYYILTENYTNTML